MKVKQVRCYWYVFLLVLAVVAVKHDVPVLSSGWLSALAVYVPLSLAWIPLGRWLGRAEDASISGPKEQKICSAFVVVGGFLSVLALHLSNTSWFSFSLLVFLAGIDGFLNRYSEQ
jgi:hypothetical protein